MSRRPLGRLDVFAPMALNNGFELMRHLPKPGGGKTRRMSNNMM